MNNPIKDVLPREIESEGLKNLLNYYANGIDQVVNFGTHVIKWDLELMNRDVLGDKHLPIMLSLRNFVELVDSTSILIRQSSIDPCKVILRSMLETYFNLEYLLEKDSEQRALNFMGWHSMQKLKFYKKLDNSRPEGKQLLSKIKKDKTTQNFQIGNIPNLEEAINNIESLFQKKEYSSIKQEFTRLKKQGEKNPKWHRLFNGPKTLVDLANHVNLSGLYEFLYRFWSGPIHGTDIIDGKIVQNNEQKIDMFQIRFPKDAQAVSNYIVSISLMVYMLIIDKRIPSKRSDFENWYLTIQDFYLKLGSSNNIEIN